MHNASNPPGSGQKTLSMWSAPSTPEQQAYYSTHSPKRRVFGIAQTGLQVAHIALAFAAWQGIFQWAFRNFEPMLEAVPYIAFAVLVLLHIIWRATWDTYWYDKLDDRTETDSSIWLPLAIAVVLLVSEKQGATLYFAGQVKPPTATNTATLDEQFAAKLGAFDARYERERSDLEAVWTAKAQGAAARFERDIAAWQRRKATSEADRQFIARNIATLSRQRDAAVAKATEGKAEEMHRLLAEHEQRKDQAESRHLALLDRADNSNAAELTRYQADLSDVERFAWLISLFFVGCAAALGYARVRINVRSGILPLRSYSTLDQHGSALEKFWIALADGTSRQLHRASVALHRALSPRESLTDFDGNVVIAAGDYNSNPPELKAGAEVRPTPPSNGERLMRDRFEAAWARYCETGDERDRAEAGGERSELYNIHHIIGVGKDDGSVFFQRTIVPQGKLNALYPLPRIGAPKAALATAPARETAAVILSSGEEPETWEMEPLPLPVTQPPQAVTQTNELAAMVRFRIQDIKREPYNLTRRDANKASVIARIRTKVAALENDLATAPADQRLPHSTVADACQYLYTLQLLVVKHLPEGETFSVHEVTNQLRRVVEKEGEQ